MNYVIIEEFDGIKIKAVVKERAMFRIFKKVDVYYNVCDSGFPLDCYRNPNSAKKLRTITSVEHAVSVIEEWRDAPERYAKFKAKMYNEKGELIDERNTIN